MQFTSRSPRLLGTAATMEEDDDTKESAVVRRSSPAADDPAADSSAGGSSHEYTDIEKEVFDRLLDKGIPEVVSDPAYFREELHRHFERLPLSYAIDVDVDRAEDVLLHRRILAECADPDKRPVFHVRFLHCIQIHDPELDYSEDNPWPWGSPTSSSRDLRIHLHQIIFSSIDRPKLLSQLSEVGLNIREAHVFSITDGFGLHIFVVDGWDTEETDDLLECLKETAAHNYVSLSNRTNFGASERRKELQEKSGDSNVNRSLLEIRGKIASGSS